MVCWGVRAELRLEEGLVGSEVSLVQAIDAAAGTVEARLQRLPGPALDLHVDDWEVRVVSLGIARVEAHFLSVVYHRILCEFSVNCFLASCNPLSEFRTSLLLETLTC